MSVAAGTRDEALAALEQGVSRFAEDDLLGAHADFAQAYRRAAGEARVLSWYGLTLLLVERNSNLGMALCDQAIRLAGPTPELLLNQARAHLALGQRDRAVKVLQRGLAVEAGHPLLRAALEGLGRRHPPVLPLIGRNNPLNKLLGRLRHRWSGRPSPPPVTPMTLGRPPRPPPGPADG
jgi:hypothetical protein